MTGVTQFDTTPATCIKTRRQKSYRRRAASFTYLFNLRVLILVFRRFFFLPLGFLHHHRRGPGGGLLSLSFLFLLLFIPLGKEIVQALLCRYIRHFQRATLTS